jgi:hypothetical protein
VFSTFETSVFLNNTVPDPVPIIGNTICTGGAIYFVHSENFYTNITLCTFDSNRGCFGSGVSFLIWNGVIAQLMPNYISNCTFDHGLRGTDVYMGNSTLIFTDSSIMNSFAQGIFLKNSQNNIIRRALITSNELLIKFNSYNFRK